VSAAAAAAAERSSTGDAVVAAHTVVATLSNLRTLSRWTYPQVAAAAHRYDSARSRVLGHLQFLTVDGPTLSEWPGGGVVGIHGTNEPQLIPGRPSHGCIRLRNADITRLWQMIQIGTPIEIV
jgi:lipoprotein-anchoring transpeptidase ErfK/SrfK